ncbi:sensor histidine kinase [Puia sp.]|uniref:sensor histidine kinase n=1 Tax=Puia sp. TaxID=2045100 RepID=UPI002F40F239
MADHIAGIPGAFIAPAGTDPGNSFCFPLELSPHCYGQLCIPAGLPDGLRPDQRKALEELASGIARMFAAKKQFATHNGNQAALTAEAQDKLDRQREFYENILNKLPTDIAVFDANHRYLFVNPGAISNEEYRKFIIGKDDYEYVAYRNRDISIADSRRAKFLEAREAGKEIRWEETMIDPSGNQLTHLRRMFPVYDENGEFSMVIGFGMEISDRKALEEKQARLVRQLSTQNTQLIDFCNIVSHNLRAPLVNISMLVDILGTSDDLDEHKLLTSKLRPVLDNLHSTFNELVESIQIRQNPEIRSEKLSVQEGLQRTTESLQTEIHRLEAEIEADFASAPVINFPPQYLRSILLNLISNALKYHCPGRPPRIRVTTRREKDKIVLAVADNGLGVDLVKHRDSFFKIGKVFHRHPDAKGFGLFMTKTQVEAMGGRIWVESEPQIGTTFYIEFINQQNCLP